MHVAGFSFLASADDCRTVSFHIGGGNNMTERSMFRYVLELLTIFHTHVLRVATSSSPVEQNAENRQQNDAVPDAIGGGTFATVCVRCGPGSWR